MTEALYKFFTSVRLTVVLLALGGILVFWGTLAQVTLGLYRAQDEFFRSMLIYWQPGGADFRIPIFPGGYLIGGLLVINLFAAHLRYYQPGKRKLGIAMIHIGIVLLLVGQFVTDLLSVESYMHIREGAKKNFSESNGRWELAVVDTSDPETDKVVAIPEAVLERGGEIRHAELPFPLRVKKFHPNSQLTTRPTEGFTLVEAANSVDMAVYWRGVPLVTEMNRRDTPSALVELIGPAGDVQAILVSGYFDRPQVLTAGGRQVEFQLRPERYYKPYYLHLMEFRFDRYPGTEIPKNFSSRVRVQRLDTGEDREVTIRMNEPLRYDGKTFFQSSFDQADEKGTVLQVVDNPSWLTPYFACVIVALGMCWQFFGHLISWAAKRKQA
jgi:hypothetical protein